MFAPKKKKFCLKCKTCCGGPFCTECGGNSTEIPACECGYNDIWPHEKFCQECGREVNREHAAA